DHGHTDSRMPDRGLLTRARSEAPTMRRLGLALVVVVDLAADLAARPGAAVHVRVGHAGTERVDELLELAGPDALPRREGRDVGRRNRPGHDRFVCRPG